MIPDSLAYTNHTSVCKPEGFLNSIIDEYVFRNIQLNDGDTLRKYMPSRHSTSIDFFIGDVYDTFDLKTGELKPFIRCTIRGPRTHKKNSIVLRGNFKLFSLRFKPAGIYALLGIPMEEFCDEAIDARLINDGLFHELTNQLLECKDIHSCIRTTEPFIKRIFDQDKTTESSAGKLAGMIIGSCSSVPVQLLYKDLPLTSRQLERNFAREIGLTPKRFSTMVRFERLLHQVKESPGIKWTELAYQHNYFDQMHLIKDFHKFLDINPNDFRTESFAI